MDRKSTPWLKSKKLRWDRARTRMMSSIRCVTSGSLSRRVNESKYRSFFEAARLLIRSWVDKRCAKLSSRYRTLPKWISSRAWKAGTWRCCSRRSDYRIKLKRRLMCPKSRPTEPRPKGFESPPAVKSNATKVSRDTCFHPRARSASGNCVAPPWFRRLNRAISGS